jgi:hypothetical protein
MSIADRFQTLLNRVQPTNNELGEYERHADTIKKRLAAAFPGTRVQIIGSHSRGSAIRGSSDLDLLAQLPIEDVRWGNSRISSDTLLAKVKGQLQDRYYATDMRRDAQALVVNFRGGAFNVDVVPGTFDRMVAIGGTNRPAYLIPDGRAGWLFTSPQAHNEYVFAADQRSGGKLKYTAQLIKAWRDTRQSIALSSFHVELLLAQDDVCVGAKGYGRCLMEALVLLDKRQCRALQDPLGLSGLISAASTAAKVDATAAAVHKAAYHAQRACYAEEHLSVADAYEQWNIVFQGAFPAR